MQTKTPKKKVTLMIDADVYHSLKNKVGERGMGTYMSTLVRPFVFLPDIDNGYKALASDTIAKKESKQWLENISEPLSVDVENEVWHF